MIKFLRNILNMEDGLFTDDDTLFNTDDDSEDLEEEEITEEETGEIEDEGAWEGNFGEED